MYSFCLDFPFAADIAEDIVYFPILLDGIQKGSVIDGIIQLFLECVQVFLSRVKFVQAFANNSLVTFTVFHLK